MSNHLSKAQDFSPTPAMRLWLDTSMQLMTDNISLISEQCKVTRQSWYLWLKNQEFQTWFCSEWAKQLCMFGWKLDVIGLKRAERDFKYWEAMQRRVGNLDGDKHRSPSDQVIPLLNTIQFVRMDNDPQ